MNFKKHSHFLRLSKIGVLLLYIPFFVVQVFYNFDINRLSGTESAGLTYQHLVAKQYDFTFSHANKSPEKKLNIRLNKRFHPESAPFCALITADVPVYFSSTVLLKGYLSPALFLSPQLTRSLRGPPAIV